jgi:hypothetical protein
MKPSPVPAESATDRSLNPDRNAVKLITKHRTCRESCRSCESPGDVSRTKSVGSEPSAVTKTARRIYGAKATPRSPGIMTLPLRDSDATA